MTPVSEAGSKRSAVWGGARGTAAPWGVPCRRVLLLAVALTLLGLAGCNWDPVWKKAPYRGAVVYYQADLHLFNRTDEITEEQAKELEAYFVGYFDADGRVSRTENYFRGERVYSVNYEYYGDGQLKSQEMTRGDGRREVFEFDPAGRLIEE